jgi:hypothetical protein
MKKTRWRNLTAAIVMFILAGTQDAKAGTITILHEELYMTLSLSMVFPSMYQINPWVFFDTYNGSGVVDQRLYGGNYPGRPTGAESSSWFYDTVNSNIKAISGRLKRT